MHVHVCMSMYMHIYICMYVCHISYECHISVCVCMYFVYIYIYTSMINCSHTYCKGICVYDLRSVLLNFWSSLLTYCTDKGSTGLGDLVLWHLVVHHWFFWGADRSIYLSIYLSIIMYISFTYTYIYIYEYRV